MIQTNTTTLARSIIRPVKLIWSGSNRAFAICRPVHRFKQRRHVRAGRDFIQTPLKGPPTKSHVRWKCSYRWFHGFATTCGIRIHGNASRDPAKNPKHGFKLNSKAPLERQVWITGCSPNRRCNNLTTSSFAEILTPAGRIGTVPHRLPDSAHAAPDIRDAWAKDTFRAMGRVAGHHRYVNLFINGIVLGHL